MFTLQSWSVPPEYPDFFSTWTHHVCRWNSVEDVQSLIRRPSECTLLWLRCSEAGDDHHLPGRLSSISCSHGVSRQRLPVHQGSVTFQILSRASKVAKDHWEDVNFYLNTYLKHIYLRLFAIRFFSSSCPKCLCLLLNDEGIGTNYQTSNHKTYIIERIRIS